MENMKLSHQAMGALMLALQKCLLEQSDILKILDTFEFVNTEDGLVVANPPTVSVSDENIRQPVLVPE